MQVEVGIDRLLKMFSDKIGELTVENLKLRASNEVLSQRLQGYMERDMVQRRPESEPRLAFPNGEIEVSP